MNSDELAKPSDQLDPASGLSTGTAPQLAVSGQQRALLRALERRDKALASMYQGALWVLANAHNPDRIAQCAHSIRELMEKLPEVLDVPVKAQKESLKAKVKEVEDAFANACKRSTCRTSGADWDGEVDSHLRKLLAHLQRFFDWFSTHHPRRREELNSVLDRLDGSGRSLPEALAHLNVDAWDKKRDFFQAVAHHRKIVEEVEFLRWCDALGRFLLDRLQPRTFDDFEAIDALLSQGRK